MLLDRQWKLTVRDGALVRGRIIQVTQSLFLHPLPTAVSLQARHHLGSLHTWGL